MKFKQILFMKAVKMNKVLHKTCLVNIYQAKHMTVIIPHTRRILFYTRKIMSAYLLLSIHFENTILFQLFILYLL